MRLWASIRACVGMTLSCFSCQALAVDFVRDVQPLLETTCLSCHFAEKAEGGLRLDGREVAMAGGDSGAAIVPGNPDESLLYTRTLLEKDDPELMPPSNANGPLDSKTTDVLKQWIADGADWPADSTLRPKERSAPTTPSPDNRELVARIRGRILEESMVVDADAMADYENEIPLTKVPYRMVAIRGGEFLMGSPTDEAGRQEHEGPATRVRVDPFWIGKYEVTWDEYGPFMVSKAERRKDGMRKDYDPLTHTTVDAVSQPTSPYMEMSFGMGRKGYPAISMTHHAANKYCQWLSAQTGHFYRLPTEAEWEYACRAGSTTAYSFGDDPSQLDQYAWHYENSDEKYQKVGLKKPNAWGLYDMHGNVMEWTADQFAADYFTQIGPSPHNPRLAPERLYPRSVRGGGWEDDPDKLRSAARRGSESAWQLQDPQLPKSQWYLTDARWLGFRIVRPLATPSEDEMFHYWNNGLGKR